MGGSILTDEEKKEKEHKKYLAKKIKKESETYFKVYWNYKRCYWKNFPYDKLNKITYIHRPGRVKDEDKDVTFNDVIIMADTETSKKRPGEPYHNHIVAWTISIRAFGKNICTLYGSRPSEMIACFEKLLENMRGQKTICYIHNLPFDWIGLRKFMIAKFGIPCKQLNVKQFYPIYIEFPGGLILRDSLILSQTSLEKWANDLDVEHKKAVGLWDYDKFRNQGEEKYFTDDELEYIEHDTLAGVECIDNLMTKLGKTICTMPWTMTGIVREEVKKEGKKHHAHDTFVKLLPTWEQQQKLEKIYHGGFTHGNRHFYGKLIRTKDGWDFVEGYDFSSSYPYTLVSEMYPAEPFREETNMTIEEILENSDQYAYMFKLTLIGVELISDQMPMPMLQLSKCVDCKNPVLDNGKIVQSEFLQIYMNEVDLEVFASMYKWHYAKITECEVTRKAYLPRWFTDLVYKLFKEKTMLKGGDPVLYALAKGRLNSLYGMTVQHPCKPDIVEQYTFDPEKNLYDYADITEEAMKEKYKQYGENKSNVLNYFVGCWVTSYAMRNLFRLGSCIDYKHGGEWFYSDTDSIYCVGMDRTKLLKYNENVKQILTKRGYGAVLHKGREYWLGIAEHDELEDSYSEFKFMGAKRYVGRCKEDGELHLTCAGVPKKRGVKCLHDDINEFKLGKIFDGITTGKLTHTHFIIPEIYIDKNGNETGDSIDLSPCDYKLSIAELEDWDPFSEEVFIQVYDEEFIL